MDQQQKIQKAKKTYQKLSQELRQEVLRRILVNKEAISEVAKDLNLKYCTCRAIKQAYEMQGRIGKKQTRKRRIIIKNQISISLQNTPDNENHLTMTNQKNILIEKIENQQEANETHNLLTIQLNNLIDQLSMKREVTEQNVNEYSNLKTKLILCLKNIAEKLNVKLNQQLLPYSPLRNTSCQQTDNKQDLQQQTQMILSQIQQQQVQILMESELQKNLIFMLQKLIAQMQFNFYLHFLYSQQPLDNKAKIEES